jgi:hypothetical protein
MREWLSAADRLLRGQWGTKEALASGTIAVRAGTLIALGGAGGAIYGLGMGLFGVMRDLNPTWKQMLANAVKVPALFLLTLLVAFPSLYAFSALANSKLRFVDTLKLLLVAIAVNLLLLASFAPVTAFFTVSTPSYAFMVLLNVAFFAVSGAVGLAVLSRTLGSVFEVPKPSIAPLGADASKQEREQHAAEVRQLERRAVRLQSGPKRIFFAWSAIYGLVGSQMGWILRPFIGAPAAGFEIFRTREGSFFEGFFTALGKFLMGS